MHPHSQMTYCCMSLRDLVNIERILELQYLFFSLKIYRIWKWKKKTVHIRNNRIHFGDENYTGEEYDTKIFKALKYEADKMVLKWTQPTEVYFFQLC